jgi:hypothetical protein
MENPFLHNYKKGQPNGCPNFQKWKKQGKEAFWKPPQRESIITGVLSIALYPCKDKNNSLNPDGERDSKKFSLFL